MLESIKCTDLYLVSFLKNWKNRPILWQLLRPPHFPIFRGQTLKIKQVVYIKLRHEGIVYLARHHQKKCLNLEASNSISTRKRWLQWTKNWVLIWRLSLLEQMPVFEEGHTFDSANYGLVSHTRNQQTFSKCVSWKLEDSESEIDLKSLSSIEEFIPIFHPRFLIILNCLDSTSVWRVSSQVVWDYMQNL